VLVKSFNYIKLSFYFNMRAIFLRIDDEEYQRLSEYARRNKRSLTGSCRYAISELIKKNGTQ